jgi:hypothetical protein
MFYPHQIRRFVTSTFFFKKTSLQASGKRTLLPLTSYFPAIRCLGRAEYWMPTSRILQAYSSGNSYSNFWFIFQTKILHQYISSRAEDRLGPANIARGLDLSAILQVCVIPVARNVPNHFLRCIVEIVMQN